MDSAGNSTALTSTKRPSLKGITSSNDDPDACANCSSPFPDEGYYQESIEQGCCGARLCQPCKIKSTPSCPCCGPLCTVSKLKKLAKKGLPWAQYNLGRAFSIGEIVNKSDFDSVRWLRKAAAQGHPRATWMLACLAMRGEGCQLDFEEARDRLATALALDPRLSLSIKMSTMQLGVFLAEANRIDEAKNTLLPISEQGLWEAQFYSGLMAHREEDHSNALRWFYPLALSGTSALDGIPVHACDAATYAYPSAIRTGKIFLIRPLRVAVSKMNLEGRATATLVRRQVEHSRPILRDLMRACLGCGESITRETRKTCKQCMTASYCSRECQVISWNHCHRDDCLEVLELVEKGKKIRDSNSKRNCRVQYI